MERKTMTSAQSDYTDAGINRRTLLGSAVLAASLAAVGGPAASATVSGPGAQAAARGLSAVPLAAPATLQASTYAHPGLLHTMSDLSDIAARVEAQAQPWQDGFSRLVANGRSHSDWTPRPLATVIRGGTGQNYMQMVYDIHAAYQNALRWHVTGGDEAHGAAAVR